MAGKPQKATVPVHWESFPPIITGMDNANPFWKPESLGNFEFLRKDKTSFNETCQRVSHHEYSFQKQAISKSHNLSWKTQCVVAVTAKFYPSEIAFHSDRQ